MRKVAAKQGSYHPWSVVRERRSLTQLLLLLWHSDAIGTPPAAGEGRSVLDAANADFVESIRSGTCPRELDPLDPSKHVSLAVLCQPSASAVAARKQHSQAVEGGL